MAAENSSSGSSDETGDARLAVVAGCSSSEDQVRLSFSLVVLLLPSLSRVFVRSVSEAALFYRDHIPVPGTLVPRNLLY